MIRSFARLGTLLALSLVLLNCSKKEDTPNPTAAVQGNWKLSGLSANPGIKLKQGTFTGVFSDLYPLVALQYPCITNVTLTLTGTTTQLNTPTGCTFTDAEVQRQLGVSFNGTYVITGNKLEFTSSTGTKTSYDLTTSAGTMTWAYQGRFTDPDDPTKQSTSTVTLTFQKAP